MTDKPTLVLLHGHGVSPLIWDDLYAALSDTYSIMRPDFSRMTSHTTVEAYAEDLYSMLATSQISRCVLIGHSMGGYVALALAAAHPDLVAALVLFNSTAFADPDTDEQREKRQTAQEMLQTEGSEPFVTKSIASMFSTPNQQKKADLVQHLIDDHKTLPAEALLAGLQAIRTRPDRSDRLVDAPFPVLIIAGRHDDAIPYERTQALKAKLPGAQLVTLENSGHLGMIEEPTASIEAVKQFVRMNDTQ